MLDENKLLIRGSMKTNQNNTAEIYEDEEMKIAQEEIKEIRAMLLKEQEEIQNLLNDKREVFDTEVGDEIDNSVNNQEREMQSRMELRHHQKLQLIEDALSRMDSGEYGWCEETGDWIGKKRLMALPFTRLSVEAQQELERQSPNYRYSPSVENVKLGDD